MPVLFCYKEHVNLTYHRLKCENCEFISLARLRWKIGQCALREQRATKTEPHADLPGKYKRHHGAAYTAETWTACSVKKYLGSAACEMIDQRLIFASICFV